MQGRLGTIIGAVVWAAIHFVVAVFPLLRWSGNGEWYSPWDMPLEALYRSFRPLNNIINHGSTSRYVLFISVAGTIMYAVGGAAIGYVFDRFFQNGRRGHGH